MSLFLMAHLLLPSFRLRVDRSWPFLRRLGKRARWLGYGKRPRMVSGYTSLVLPTGSDHACTELGRLAVSCAH